MSHSEQKREGNTNTSRSRSWCFTLNNYTKEDITLFKNLNKYVFQEETGENGTPHLQGVVQFKDAKNLTTLKKLHPRAHWEKCRSWKASVNYCSKAETRTGDGYSNVQGVTFTEHKDTTQKPVFDFREILWLQEMQKEQDMVDAEVTNDDVWDKILPMFKPMNGR